MKVSFVVEVSDQFYLYSLSHDSSARAVTRSENSGGGALSNKVGIIGPPLTKGLSA